MTKSVRIRKSLPRYAGLRLFRRARVTGTCVGLYDAREAGIDVEPDRWAIVCEVHNVILSARTKRLAELHMSVPDDWCEFCRSAKR